MVEPVDVSPAAAAHFPSGFPCLETERLELRPFRSEDRQTLLELYSDPEVTAAMMEPLSTPEQAQEVLEDYRGCFVSGRGIVWAITLKGSPRLIGTCGFEHISWYDGRAEIGYDLESACWGRGLMGEAMQAVLGYSFATLGLNRIQAYVLTGNEASLRLLARHGFRTEGTLRQYRSFKGAFTDWVLLALLREDWNRHAA